MKSLQKLTRHPNVGDVIFNMLATILFRLLVQWIYSGKSKSAIFPFPRDDRVRYILLPVWNRQTIQYS